MRVLPLSPALALRGPAEAGSRAPGAGSGGRGAGAGPASTAACGPAGGSAGGPLWAGGVAAGCSLEVLAGPAAGRGRTRGRHRRCRESRRTAGRWGSWEREGCEGRAWQSLALCVLERERVGGRGGGGIRKVGELRPDLKIN